jgi:hypothetical protein
MTEKKSAHKIPIGNDNTNIDHAKKTPESLFVLPSKE